MRGKKYFLTLAVVYLAYLTHGIQAIVLSQNAAHFAEQWGTDVAGVTGIIAYTGLAKFVTVWICGEISDKLGRKIMAMIGALMYVAAFFGVLTTHSLGVAGICAFMMGAATSFFDGSLYAAAQESWIKAPGAATILIKGFISVSGIIYPLLVAYLSGLGGSAWRVGIIIPVVMSAILCVIAFIAPYSYDEELKEKKAAGTVEKKDRNALDADAQYAANRFKTPAPKWLVVPLAIMGFINMSTMYSAQQFLKLYGQSYCGMSEMKAASLASLYTVGSLAAVIIWAVALAALRWRTLQVLIIDLCGSILFYALVVTVKSQAVVQAACIGIGFFAAGGALQCGVTLINEFHPGPKGRNLGIYYTMMGLSGYVMPVIASKLITMYQATGLEQATAQGLTGDELTATAGTIASGLASRMSLGINLIFAIVGLAFCLFLAANYEKWFGVKAFSKKGPDDIY